MKIPNINVARFVPNAVTVKAARAGLVLSKNSPQILFAAGIVGVVGCTVLACRATLKLEGVLEDGQMDMADANILLKTPQVKTYGQKDFNRDRNIIFVKTAVKVGKLYAPAFLVGGLAIVCLTKSHNILQSRNTALTAAYVAVDKAFKAYRGRVQEEIGEEKERKLYYEVTNDEVIVEGTNGPKKVKKEVAHGTGIYGRVFDQNNPNWVPALEYNIFFLRTVQNTLNDQLHSKGHVMLNDAYDALGFERTTAGTVTGWVRGHGDNFIEFGVFNTDGENIYQYINGPDGEILIDFNVDGVVYDLIEGVNK